MCGGSGLATQSCPTLVTPWIIAHQTPLSMGFSRQECWNGLPFSSPGDLPDAGIELRSPALQEILYLLSFEGSPCVCVGKQIFKITTDGVSFLG